MRIDKYLCDSGKGTRKEVKQLLKDGKVSVNGKVIKKADFHVKENEDTVTLAGEEIIYKKYVYLMMNKPAGYLSATEDKRLPVVTELLDDKYKHYEVFCAGRLDIDTTGFLLLTNDGEFAHHITSPRHHVFKKYYAKIDGEVTEDDKVKMHEGITLDDGYTCLPAKLEILSADGGVSEIYLTIREGKFHQVKRMFEAVGKRVTSLERVEVGGVELDENLEYGHTRELTEEEYEGIKNQYSE